jgi:serine/threonine protein phosphatase PrpC
MRDSTGWQAMSNTALEFNFHGDAIRGERLNQEDCWKVQRINGGAAERPSVIAILSDGMGGHASGEIASELACDHFLRAFTSRNGAITDRLEHSLTACNAALGRAVNEDADLSGMGCTLVACYVDQKGLYFASVGDSLLLLFRGRTIKRINQDHSIGALLDKQAEAQIISRSQAVNSPRRRTLRSALTGAEIPLRDICERPIELQPGDWLLIASDGLETLSQGEIEQIMSAVSDGAPQSAVAALLRGVVNKRSENQDNTSVIALKVADPHDATTRILRRRDDYPKTEILHAAPRRGKGKGRGAQNGALIAVALAAAIAAVAGGWWAGGWWAGSLQPNEVNARREPEQTPNEPRQTPAPHRSQPSASPAPKANAPSSATPEQWRAVVQPAQPGGTAPNAPATPPRQRPPSAQEAPPNSEKALGTQQDQPAKGTRPLQSSPINPAPNGE